MGALTLVLAAVYNVISDEVKTPDDGDTRCEGGQTFVKIEENYIYKLDADGKPVPCKE